MFRLPAPFVANLCIAWLPLLFPWSSFLRPTEMLPPRLRVLNIPQNKITLRLWLYFLVNSISSSNEYSGLISLKGNWFHHLAVQGTLRRLLQHYSPKASILEPSTFFMAQLSQPHVTTGKTIDLTTRTFVSWRLIGPKTYTTAIQILPPSGITLYFFFFFFPQDCFTNLNISLILTFKSWNFHVGSRLKFIHF